MTQLNVPGPCECLSVNLVPGRGWVVIFQNGYLQELTLIGNEADAKPEFVVGATYSIVLHAASIRA